MKRKLEISTTSHPYSTRSKRTKIASEIPVLPTDVMILIFKLLTPSERRKATTVCHQWLDLVNQYFSKDNCLVLSSDLDYSTTGSLYQTFSSRLTTTKDKRTFSHMEIESFPYNAGKLQTMGNFIKLVGAEVTSLKIRETYYPETMMGTRFKFNLFSKLPKLETLELSSHSFIAGLSSAINLKRIKILSMSCGVKQLKNYRKLKSLENLTIAGIKILGQERNDKLLVSILEPKTKALLAQMVPLEPYDGITLETPTFNFCGAARLTPDDINGIHIENCNKVLPQKILGQFKNLKRLKLSHKYSRPLVLTPKRRAYSGITELEVHATSSDPPPNFDKFLQSFPNLEKLKIDDFPLKIIHFLIICRGMPKLKELVLRGCHMDISVRTVLDGQFSLKDLPLLEKLEINTQYRSNSGQWPSLPNLKELSLLGDGFGRFNVDFYSQIAQKCPKLTHVTIEDIDFDTRTYNKFLPLMTQLKLTHLSLPCLTLNFEESYTELVENLIEHCQELKEVTITDGIGFSLSQEVELFSDIASLEIVTSVKDSEMDQKRVMKRKDVKDLKGYLFNNLALYKKLSKTVEYVAYNVIFPNEFYEMKRSFQKNYANDEDDEELANCYIVAHKYLGMNHIDFCKLVLTISDDN